MQLRGCEILLNFTLLQYCKKFYRKRVNVQLRNKISRYSNGYEF